MFTGIITFTATVVQFEPYDGYWRLGLDCPGHACEKISLGASVSVDGVCLTVIAHESNHLYFDVIAETMRCTSFSSLQVGNTLNGERAACFGDEIGGHILSGHVQTVARLISINQTQQQYILTCSLEDPWLSYIFPKGYIALAGTSLTVAEVNLEEKTFTVHLIPETLRRTNLGEKPLDGFINLEIDHQTHIIVDTLLRRELMLTKMPKLKN